jgi:acyl-CoA synthetase (AMP-forming)/AMP-acid ligase II
MQQPATPVDLISDLVRAHARQSAAAEALVCGDLRLSYAEVVAEVDALSRALIAAGARQGDRVATLSPPHPYAIVAMLAAFQIGCVWLGLNPKNRPGELARLAADAQPAVLLSWASIAGESMQAAHAAISAAVPGLQGPWLFDRPGDPDGLDARILEARALPVSALAERRAAIDRRDPCLIVYTSGSTGRPKGALLHHEGVLRFSLAQNRRWSLSRTNLLNYFPINHVGSICDISCPALAAGGKLVFMPEFDPDRALETMISERISLWGSVPSVFEMQLDRRDCRSLDLSAVELIVWEGAALSRARVEQLLALGKPLATNYGMTETTSAITIVDPTRDPDILTGSVGHPIDGAEVRLRMPDGEIADGAGVPGEIEVRSRSNCLGYWRQPEATAAAFTEDGYFRTGDLGEWRSDGRLRIVGRLREMFKSGGYNVYPREIEETIEIHPLVVAAAVVGVADPLWQEVGAAFIVARPGLTVADLRRHCGLQLANYKVPKHFRLVDELPLLPNGKIDRRGLAQAANPTEPSA